MGRTLLTTLRIALKHRYDADFGHPADVRAPARDRLAVASRPLEAGDQVAVRAGVVAVVREQAQVCADGLVVVGRGLGLGAQRRAVRRARLLAHVGGPVLVAVLLEEVAAVEALDERRV